MSTAKTLFKNLPVLVRVGIYIGCNYLLIFLAQVITGFLPIKGELSFNLLFCILLLFFTKFILQLEGASWKDIGCIAGNGKDSLYLFAGTIGGVVMMVLTAFCMKLIAGFQWNRNPDFRWYQLFTLFVTIFCSAFAQELSYRGYPFRIMIKKWGEWPAQIIIALLFGVMHLSANMGAREMFFTMITTGAGSVLFGIAVIKTKRLHLAVGIHFGWNYAQLLLPRHPSQNGRGIWLVTGMDAQPEIGYLIWIAPYIIIAMMAYFIIRYFVPGSHPEPGTYNW